MVLVDSSLWIPSLRRRGHIRDHEELSALIRNGEAAWCAAIRLELWAAIGDARERDMLARFRSVVLELPVTDRVWEKAIELDGAGRTKGWTFPYSDLLIFACAKEHGVKLVHRDKHFNQLAKL